jgi:hypothetical protein
VKRLAGIVLAACAALSAQTVGRVTGRVVAQGEGRGLRAEITAVAVGGAIRMNHAATDEQGAYAIEAPAGRVLIMARADGYASEEAEVAVSPGGRSPAVNFQLLPAGEVSGRAIGPDGSGIANARVWLEYRGRARGWRPGEETGGEPADAFGYFTIPVVAQGRPFVLHAEGDGWLLSSSGTMTLRGQELRGVTLLLARRGGSVSGRVVDSSGQPVANAAVHLRAMPVETEFTAAQRASVALTRKLNRTAIAGADGSYIFRAVPDGRVILRTEARGRQAAAEAELIQGGEIRLDLLVR